MALSRVEIAAAGKMHRFVRGCEKHPSSALRSMWIVLPVTLANSDHLFHARNHVFICVYLGVLGTMMIGFYFLDRARPARYARARPLVVALEREHADELPWMADERLEKEVEKHLAAVQRIQRDLAHSHA